GPPVVVDLTPRRQMALYGGVVPPFCLGVQHLQIQASVEALVLAPRLRMVRPAVPNLDAQLDELSRVPRVRLLVIAIAPGRAIIDEDDLRQAILVEGREEMLSHRFSALV